MRGFIAYGLRVRSDIAIPGGLADPGAVDAHEIEVALDSPSAAQSDRVYRFEGEDLCFTMPGVAEYHCRSERIRVVPHPAASEVDIAAMLIATAFPALLWMRGSFVLHAAAVRLPESRGAVAIAGPSGIGKSMILAQLVAVGASMAGDDTIVIGTRDGVGEAAGLPGGYFIGDKPGAPRTFRPLPPDRSLVRTPLAAILVLSRADPGAILRLAPVEGVAQLLAHRHRPRVPALLGRHAQTLADSALLAGSIPIYGWNRSHGTGELAAWEWDALARCAVGNGETE